jgi:hypothetical protein
MKEYQDQELYKALGLKMDEVLGKDNHDAIVLEKLKSRG